MAEIVGRSELVIANGYRDDPVIQADVVALSGGGWVVSWVDERALWGYAVRVQRFGADGIATSEAVQVSPEIRGGGGRDSHIASLADGGWVATWIGGYTSAILLQQAYNADGTLRGEAEEISASNNVANSHGKDSFQCLGLPTGGWVVTWTTYNDVGGNDIYQQVYSSEGRQIGSATAVNTERSFERDRPEIALLADGGWVVTWTAARQDGESSPWDYGVYQQAYNTDGTRRGEEIRVNTEISGEQSEPHVTALLDGGWVVTWQSQFQDGYEFGVYQQAFNSDGSARGEEIQVNSFWESTQRDPEIVALADGGWVVIWRSYDQAYPGYDLYQQAFNANGTRRGDETLINDRLPGDQDAMCVAALSDGGWVVLWYDSTTSKSYQQVYLADGSAFGSSTAIGTAQTIVSQVVALDDGSWVLLGTTYAANRDSHIFQRQFRVAEPPVLILPSEDQSVPEGQSWNFVIPDGMFSDADGDTLTYFAFRGDGSELPSWMSFDARTKTFSGTPPENFNGTIEIKITTSDGWSTASDIFDLVVTSVNDAPELTQTFEDLVAKQGVAFGFAFGADFFTDADTGDTLTYFATLANGDPLPSWLSFDAVNRSFSGTPANDDVGIISITVTATDGSNASVSDTFDITVGNVNDAPEVSETFEDLAAKQGEVFGFAFGNGFFMDADTGDTLTYFATLANGDPLPSWLSFDAVNRSFSGTPGNDDVGVISIKLTATDGSNASVSDTFDITVGNVNDAPEVSGTFDDLTAKQGEVFGFAFGTDFFTDVDAGDTLTYSATLANGDPLPSWLSFDAVNSSFSGTPGNYDVGVISIKVTATDGSNASVSDTFDITVGNVNDAPELTHALADQLASEGDVFSFQFAADAFADVDGDTLTYSATLANGDPLPSWLSFDAVNHSFSGTPPAESGGVLSIKVTASDAETSTSDTFDLAINHLPTLINLSSNSVKENVKAGTVIGALSASDPDAEDQLTFTLIDNPDDAFAIKGGKLVVAAGAVIDYETQTSYSVTVRATDDGGSHRDETFTIDVTDVVDVVTGNNLANKLKGASGADIIEGLGGDDTLYGYAAHDVLYGGKGIDKLYGGAGADTFVFATGDTGKTRAKADTIFDFTKADSIDLTGIDANYKTFGLQEFDFIGARAFTGQAGELHFIKEKSDTWIEADTNGDRKADFIVHLDDAMALKIGNFDL